MSLSRRIVALSFRRGFSVVLGALLLQAGCSSPRAARRNPAPPPAPSLSAPVDPPRLAIPPQPIYRNPTIGIVHLRAHQDEEGRLLGPQVMYEVIDPGGWNVDAVEQGKGYIPAVNLEVPPSLGSPYAVRAAAAPPLTTDSPLADAAAAAQIIITGLMRPEDRPQAEAMARESEDGRTAVFDDQAGWLLLPDRTAHPKKDNPEKK